MGRGAMGRGQQEGGDREVGKRKGEKKGHEEGGISQMDRNAWVDRTYGMPGWNEITEFFDFVYPCNAGYPS